MRVFSTFMAWLNENKSCMRVDRLRCFLVFFLNIRNTRCPFSKFVLFCIVLPRRVLENCAEYKYKYKHKSTSINEV